MTGTAYWYAQAIVNAFGGDSEAESYNVDWLTNTINVCLTTSSYTPNQDTHDFYDDVTNEVANGNGYTTGGAALASKTLNNTNNVIKFDAADTSWSTSTITARRAVIYKSTGTGSTSPLLWWLDFGQDFSSVSNTFQIVWDASGMATITITDATGYP